MSTPSRPRAPSAQRLNMAFGQRHATVNQDINSLYDLITGVAPALKSYDSLGTQAFYHRTAFVGLQDLALAATVCSPMAYEVSDDEALYFILPLHGEADASSQKKSFLCSPALGAALTPGHARKGSMGEMSMVQATLDPARFKATAQTMLGEACRPLIEDRLQGPSVLPMCAGQLRFDHLFSTLCKTIDDCGMQAGTLNALGFDDVFYRTVISMAFPEQLVHGQAKPAAAARTPLDRVCDYIDAHLTEAIYLTELEAIAQLGTRALQYAFLRRFACSPTAWIRQRRLQLARHRLMHATPMETVTRIALDCGFSNPGDFARLYLQSYGEAPSATLKKSVGA
jgi:AraC-like DNA-binding protein